MKFQELEVGKTYGVIPSWDYSRQDKKDVNRVQRRDLWKATLVSLDKYEYKVIRIDNPTDSGLKPAPKGSRVVGYLVESTEGGKPEYWLSRPQDIVAPYDVLEERWTREEKEREEQERKIRDERERREKLQQDLRDKETRALNAIKESLVVILGEERTSLIRFDMNSRRDTNGDYLPVGELTLNSRIAQLLIEKVLEAKDLVG